MNRMFRLTSCLLLAGVLLLAGPALAQTTFIFGDQGEPVDLDPAIITDGISSRITRQIYEGLVKYKGDTTEVIPLLAEKWQVSPDGTVWTFTLRKNVKFHDGNPFDAAAVVWNFERWRFSKHPQHENQIKAGKTFEYYEAQFGGFDDKSLITKVEAVNPTTVRITLKNPAGALPGQPGDVHLRPGQPHGGARSGGWTSASTRWAPAPSSSWSGRWGRRSSWRPTRTTGTRPTRPRSRG